MNTHASPPVTQEIAKLADREWRVDVPDDAPEIFKTKLRWAYPAYRAYDLWSSADGLRMSAAMSFYGMLSLAPLLLLIVVALGWWLGQDAVQASLIAQVSALIGEQGATMLEGAIVATREQSSGFIASIIAIGTLIMGATGVFAELQSALERLWVQGSENKLGASWWRTATLRLKGVGYVMAFGFLLLVSLVISSALSYVENWVGGHIEAKLLLSTLNLVISLGITTAMFVGLMRMSSGPQPSLRYLAIGAVIGALLFALGKKALAMYLADAAVVSAYGAAGSLVVILFWIYFTSAVLLFAASCARVAAEMQGKYKKGSTPPPAAAVTAVQRATQAGPASGASSASVVAALADLTESFDNPNPPAPKAIHWAALLLAFAAGNALMRDRNLSRVERQTETALEKLALAKAELQALQSQGKQLKGALKQEKSRAKRAAFWQRQTRSADRRLHETKGAWLSQLSRVLRHLR